MRLWPTKRGWKRIGIGLAILLALALIVNGTLAWWAEWKLQSRIDAIRAAGDPASIAELAPEPVPDDENAAAILEQIRPRIEEFSREYARFFDTPIGKAYEDAEDDGEPPTAQQIDAIRAIVEKYPNIQQAITQAVASDQYASQLDFSLGHTEFIEQIIERVQAVRAAVRYLGWQVEVLFAEGRYDEAAQRGLQSLQLARLYEKEPTLVSYLVTVAIRGIAAQQIYDVLAAGPVSQELHDAIDAELARQDDPQSLARVMKTERALNADWFYGDLRGAGNRVVAHVLGWPMKYYQIGAIDAMGGYVKLAERPWYEARGGAIESPSPPSGFGVLADLLMPEMKVAFLAHARSVAVMRSLRIYNALRQFVDASGRKADGLDDLSLPEGSTIDPYLGEPLKLKHTDEGWIVYSVMENGVDDGGDFKDLKDYGVAPRALR